MHQIMVESCGTSHSPQYLAKCGRFSAMGSSPEEAAGRLIQKHPDFFGVSINYQQASSTVPSLPPYVHDPETWVELVEDFL